ncbi:hypothetical protein IQ13_1027 [Lacibacter cauensis]|uniref:Mannitol repressor n=1 Tax=Lacibacter cauensis TaxID=510947 RepID=A0A562SY20_9BACT|nr:hypothetical protein [Lacibacter cauensis]TWI85858.1 hypothetical protein IQ13_1027 [Lacibacter cauensis]
MTIEEQAYHAIGKALISAQRVEHMTKALVSFLIEFNDDFKGFNTKDFLDESRKFKKLKKPTLGTVFNQLKLNPKLVLVNDLDVYVQMRNEFIHSFWEKYMFSKDIVQAKIILEFCTQFGMMSNTLERFFKGFIYLLKLRYMTALEDVDSDKDKWSDEFEYFLKALQSKSLFAN